MVFAVPACWFGVRRNGVTTVVVVIVAVVGMRFVAGMWAGELSVIFSMVAVVVPIPMRLMLHTTNRFGMRRRRSGSVVVIGVRRLGTIRLSSRGRAVVVLVVCERLLNRLRSIIDVDTSAAFDHILELKVGATVGRQHVADMQEAVDATAKADKRRADARLDVDNFALIDVTEIGLPVRQLDVQLLQHAILDHCNPALLRIQGVHQHPLQGNLLGSEHRDDARWSGESSHAPWRAHSRSELLPTAGGPDDPHRTRPKPIHGALADSRER